MKVVKTEARWRVKCDAEVWTEGTAPSYKDTEFVCDCRPYIGLCDLSQAHIERAQEIAVMHNNLLMSLGGSVSRDD